MYVRPSNSRIVVGGAADDPIAGPGVGMRLTTGIAADGGGFGLVVSIFEVGRLSRTHPP